LLKSSSVPHRALHDQDNESGSVFAGRRSEKKQTIEGQLLSLAHTDGVKTMDEVLLQEIESSYGVYNGFL
jgi:hypothetical protein